MTDLIAKYKRNTRQSYSKRTVNFRIESVGDMVLGEAERSNHASEIDLKSRHASQETNMEIKDTWSQADDDLIREGVTDMTTQRV